MTKVKKQKFTWRMSCARGFSSKEEDKERKITRTAKKNTAVEIDDPSNEGHERGRKREKQTDRSLEIDEAEKEREREKWRIERKKPSIDGSMNVFSLFFESASLPTGRTCKQRLGGDPPTYEEHLIRPCEPAETGPSIDTHRHTFACVEAHSYMQTQTHEEEEEAGKMMKMQKKGRNREKITKQKKKKEWVESEREERVPAPSLTVFSSRERRTKKNKEKRKRGEDSRIE